MEGRRRTTPNSQPVEGTAHDRYGHSEHDEPLHVGRPRGVDMITEVPGLQVRPALRVLPDARPAVRRAGHLTVVSGHRVGPSAPGTVRPRLHVVSGGSAAATAEQAESGPAPRCSSGITGVRAVLPAVTARVAQVAGALQRRLASAGAGMALAAFFVMVESRRRSVVLP